MLRYQRLVARMQNVLYSSDASALARLAALAGEYAAACDEANRRLQQVAELRRAGWHHAARREIERSPHLLELVAQLEFAELPQWCRRLHELSLDTPPRVAVEIAAELSDAGEEIEPLLALLKHYRLLVLAQAPLAGRLLTLRCIRELDPHNFAWQADQCTLEQARLQEIEQAAEHFYYTANRAGLAALCAELDEPHWLSSLPVGLVERVAYFHAQLTARETAHRELQTR